MTVEENRPRWSHQAGRRQTVRTAHNVLDNIYIHLSLGYSPVSVTNISQAQVLMCM
jgi:hypothetical protein